MKVIQILLLFVLMGAVVTFGFLAFDGFLTKVVVVTAGTTLVDLGYNYWRHRSGENK